MRDPGRPGDSPREILLHLPDGQDFSRALEALDRQLSGADPMDVVVDIGTRKLSTRELLRLEEAISRHGSRLLRVTESPSRKGGSTLRIVGSSGSRHREVVEEESQRPSEDFERTLLHKGVLRAGQMIKYGGNVVILGDVNPGAEVIAGGDVVVVGTVRGLIHAGARGNSAAIVVALRLDPVQLRIGRHFSRRPEDGPTEEGGPEMAWVQDGRIVVEEYRSDVRRR